MKFVLCLVEAEFDAERGLYFYTVLQPLQIFDSHVKAEEAQELFNPFYNYDLHIVDSDKLHATL